MIRYTALILALAVPGLAQAAETTGILPESGGKSPYSAPAVPTTMKPLAGSLASLLDQGYAITTTTQTGPELVLTLSQRGHVVLCALTPPDLRNDQNIPTSRCWALNAAP
ncbi:hypothetical protein [Asaia bogorensis]|uniref:Uncharacterized protein n=1 Tax=Asaia bogorensis NBRC 16594 TaxID=1231624 RepID=A0AAN4R691_9PROT|nr:hypothetical protein [Asaia bogorensis]GBQ82062.1 hypothetical protein AA0311_2778 [Asaia bogorensis NBRC 16594]GEL54136.1 hypothetical protein ABO01nite_21430 [Asaia bogorensis NBRC 16594]